MSHPQGYLLNVFKNNNRDNDQKEEEASPPPNDTQLGVREE